MNDSSAALHKGTGGLVVDGGQGADVADQLVQQGGLNQVRLLGDEGLLGQDDLLGSHRIGGEQAPVDVASVPQVGVIGVLCGSKGSLGGGGESACYLEEGLSKTT